MRLAGVNIPIQTTRLGLYVVWLPASITAADLLPGLGVKDWEEKTDSAM